MLQEAKHLFLSGLASEAGPVLMMGRALLCYRKAQKRGCRNNCCRGVLGQAVGGV